MQRLTPVRRGFTSMLAMIYLALFSALAIGFYATTNTAVTVVDNDRRGTQAQVAAESGMEFMRFVMSRINVPSGQTGSTLLATVNDEVGDLIESTPNLGGQSVGFDGITITIPFIDIDASRRFSATIRLDATGTRVVVKTIGANGATMAGARAISLEYEPVSSSNPVFAYGFVTAGPLTMTGSAKILGGGGNPANGSILSMYTGGPNVISMTGSCQLGGDVSMVQATGNIQSTGSNSIAGTTNTALWPPHIHKGVPAPVFPTIDTSGFLPFATGTVLTGSPPAGTHTFNNGILIKANANPTFTGNKTINGVIYIETPNNVRFTGTLNLTGCIVVQNNPTGNPTVNKLTFTGNMNQSSPANLPASYGALRTMTGSCIVAPKFDISFTGSGNTMGGTILCEKLTLTGSSGGNVNGSILVTGSAGTTMTGSNPFTLTPAGATATPAGYVYDNSMNPDYSTYWEGRP